MLREIDYLLSAYCRGLTEKNANQTTWEILEQFYKLRSDLENEWYILVSGDLQRIYDEIYRRLQ